MKEKKLHKFRVIRDCIVRAGSIIETYLPNESPVIADKVNGIEYHGVLMFQKENLESIN